MTKHIYAIGMKRWIELRVASKQPTPSMTSSVISYTKKQLDMKKYYATGYPAYKEIPKKLTMKNTTFNGGKVVGMVTSRAFSNLTKVSVRKDGILELPDSIVELLKEKGFIK